MTVRTRYAPSPTGIPHVGNVRTALFAWLLARHHGGAFIVRIEDTDQARLVPGAQAAILDSLRWLGIDWDEGPEAGGAFGPYIQSERLPYYREAAESLIASGSAYRCYCSPERLEALRAEQQAAKLPPGYDRRCRSLSDGERGAFEAAGIAPVVRFAIPIEGVTAFSDRVRGEIQVENRTLDDFVILKSDGFPTYHLAVVVDDHFMEVSHVLRGDEWLPSTPRHVLLYQALGWTAPEFAHLTLILGPDKAKLSKRHGAASLLEYRDMGYLPDAMMNFLALLGWSLDDHTEVMSRDQLIESFSLDRIVKSPAVFDRDKLEWMNGVYVRMATPDRWAAIVAERLEADLPADAVRLLDRDLIARIAPLVQERVKLLTEIAPMVEFFFVPPGPRDEALLLGKRFRDDRAAAVRGLRAAEDRLRALRGWDAAAIEATLRELATELDLKAGDLFMLVRVAITGRGVTPPLMESMEALGRDESLRRIAEVQ